MRFSLLCRYFSSRSLSLLFTHSPLPFLTMSFTTKFPLIELLIQARIEKVSSLPIGKKFGFNCALIVQLSIEVLPVPVSNLLLNLLLGNWDKERISEVGLGWLSRQSSGRKSFKKMLPGFR